MKILTIIFTLFFNAFLLSYDLKGEYKCNHAYFTNIVFKNSYEAYIIIKDNKKKKLQPKFKPQKYKYSISENIITFESYNETIFFKVKGNKLYGLYDIDSLKCILIYK